MCWEDIWFPQICQGEEFRRKNRLGGKSGCSWPTQKIIPKTTAIKNNFPFFFSRLTERSFVSSVVSDLKLKDFPVENEPILGYRKGSNERKELEKELEKARNEVKDVPIMIAGEEIRTKDVRYQVSQLSLLFFTIDLFSLCPD